MRKIVVLLFTLVLSFSLLSCGKKEEEKTSTPTVEETTPEVTTPEESTPEVVKEFSKELKVISPFGSPFMSLGGLMGMKNLTTEGVKGPDLVKSALTSGSHDVILAPVNLGAQLYMKGASKYKLAAVVTMNNAYIVTKDTNKLDSIADLKDQEVLAFGQTGVPGSLLKAAYEKNSLDLAKVEFLKSSVDVYTAFSQGTKTQQYVLMSEPEISRLKVNDKLAIKTLDLSKVLDSSFAQAGVFVKEKTADTELFLELLGSSLTESKANYELYAETLVNKHPSFKTLGVDVLKSSLPNLGLTYENNPRVLVENTLKILGINLPKDDFYFEA